MDAYACSMIAVWVQPAALSAVLCTQTAIMGRTPEGAGRIRSARRLAPSSDGQDRQKCYVFMQFGPSSAWKRSTFADQGRRRRCWSGCL